MKYLVLLVLIGSINSYAGCSCGCGSKKKTVDIFKPKPTSCSPVK